MVRILLAALLLLLVAISAYAQAEDGVVTITVNTLAGDNDGICGTDPDDPVQDCSLLEAVTLANSTPGPSVIQFAVDGVIQTAAPVLITSPVILDGTTAPGGAHAVRIDASGAGGNAIEITGANASGSEVRGLVVGQAPFSGIVINSGAANVRVLGNLVGTNADGDDLGHGLDGVTLGGGATDNTIGGAAAGEGNVIGFNGRFGISMDEATTTGNTVIGNFIGTNSVGDNMGNSFGVGIGFGSSGNAIGGVGAGEGNTIGFSKNNGPGVFLFEAATNNQVLGNFIGTNAAGDDLGNSGEGVSIFGGSSDNTIGGAAPGEGNTIGFNGTIGIFASDTTGNTVLGNIIGANVADGVLVKGGAMGNDFFGNFIGTNAANLDWGNGGNGLVIQDGSTNNTIGDRTGRGQHDRL